MIELSRKQLDKMIKDMNLFPNIKAAVSEYEKEVAKLSEREQYLQDQLESLKQQHDKNTVDQQATQEIGEIVYLQKARKDILHEMDVINSLLEAISEDITQVKIKYVPIFKEAVKKDSQNNHGKYNVNEIVDLLRYEMIKAIVDLSQAMQDQYREVSGPVYDVFNDPTVKQKFTGLEYVFPSHHGKPKYSESMPYVIDRNQIFQATDGQYPRDVKPPKKDGEK